MRLIGWMLCRHNQHLTCNALRPVARCDVGVIAKGLRATYTAPTAEAAFSASLWGRKYPQTARVFEDAWDAFTPLLAFSPAVRKLLRTTNASRSTTSCARSPRPEVTFRATTPWSGCCGWPSSTSRTSAPASAPPAARKPASARTSPPAWLRANASWAGARSSTSSTPPTQAAYDKSSLTR